MHLRGARRAGRTRKRRQKLRSARRKIEIMQAGRAREQGASGLLLSLRYLKLIYLKRYVGGLVQFDGSDVCISTLLGLWFDDRVSASLFEWLLVNFVN